MVSYFHENLNKWIGAVAQTVYTDVYNCLRHRLGSHSFTSVKRKGDPPVCTTSPAFQYWKWRQLAQTSFSGSTKASFKADRGMTVLITFLILRKKPFLILNYNKNRKKILYQNIVLPVQNLPDGSYGPGIGDFFLQYFSVQNVQNVNVTIQCTLAIYSDNTLSYNSERVIVWLCHVYFTGAHGALIPIIRSNI